MPSLSVLLPPFESSAQGLPSFPPSPLSVAILGPGLPSSSAVYLSLGHLPPQPSTQGALILTRDLQSWTSCLLSDGPNNDGDAWMRERAGRGEELRALARVGIRTCPTPAHMGCLLANLDKDADAAQGWSTIVLLEPSSYYVEPVEAQRHLAGEDDDGRVGSGQEGLLVGWKGKDGVTASNYGSLIALALSAVDQLNSTRPEGHTPTRLVILDSLAPTISLPILPAPPPKLTPGKRPFGGDDRKPDLSGTARGPTLSLSEMLGAMVDWVAVVEAVVPSSAMDAEEGQDAAATRVLPPTHRLTRPAEEGGDNQRMWFREELSRWGSELGGSRGARGRWVWCNEDGGEMERG